MAKSRAQRKAEQRRRQARGETAAKQTPSDTEAQHDTQVPESADVAEAELAERGVDLDELRGPDSQQEPEAPAPSRGETAPASDKALTRREQKRLERERRDAARASVERRKPREAAPPPQRGRVMGFLASCVAELRRVQWPTRDTLIQASAVTIVFIAVAAAYLGVLDAAFNWLIQRVI